MRRNMVKFLLVVFVCMTFAGCGEKTGSKSKEKAETEKADVDLTTLSSTMVYTEVYNMLSAPEDYIGKTVKMSGSYYASFYDETDKWYHYVTIDDAAACCQQGLEFAWQGDHVYPDDYPEDGAEVEIEGVFESYEEAGATHYQIVTDNINIIK